MGPYVGWWAGVPDRGEGGQPSPEIKTGGLVQRVFLVLSGINGSLLMQGPQTHLSARLRDFIVLNADPKTVHKKVRQLQPRSEVEPVTRRLLVGLLLVSMCP